MRIGIDIDDVITNTSDLIKEYMKQYEKSGDWEKYSKEIIRGEIPTENIKIFFEKYTKDILKSVKIKEDAINIINKLKDDKNEIIFITARGEKRFPKSEEITLKFLKENKIKYDKIIFNSYEKQIDCKNNKIDIMIDDSIKNCELIKNEGIKTILFTSDVNKNLKTDIKRVNNWSELECVILKIKGEI